MGASGWVGARVTAGGAACAVGSPSDAFVSHCCARVAASSGPAPCSVFAFSSASAFATASSARGGAAALRAEVEVVCVWDSSPASGLDKVGSWAVRWSDAAGIGAGAGSGSGAMTATESGATASEGAAFVSTGCDASEGEGERAEVEVEVGAAARVTGGSDGCVCDEVVGNALGRAGCCELSSGSRCALQIGAGDEDSLCAGD